MKAKFLQFPFRSKAAGYSATGVVTTLGAIAGVIFLAVPTSSTYFDSERATSNPAAVEGAAAAPATKAGPMTGATLSAMHVFIQGEPQELPPTF